MTKTMAVDMESARVTGKPKFVNGTANMLEVTVEHTALKGGEFSRQQAPVLVRLEGLFDPLTGEYAQLPNLGQGRYLTPVVEIFVPNGGDPKRYNPREGPLPEVVARAAADYFDNAFSKQFIEQ